MTPTLERVEAIVVHHTAGPREQTCDEIRAYHTAPKPTGRGFRDVGYHFVIEADGKIRRGRELFEMGAHAIGANATTVGVAIVGDNTRMGARWLPPQIEAARRLLRVLLMVFPGARVVGHRDVTPPGHTVCPGADLREVLGDLEGDTL